MESQQGSICDVSGIRVGHAQDDQAKTGCTVIIPNEGVLGGIDIRGSAPGTREVESLKPVRLVSHVHAIFFTGGSAFGLNASGGVQKFLEERNIGYDVGGTKIPIVPSLVIFDLREGGASVRPGEKMGYTAALNASREHPQEGRAGAGRGATVGKLFGQQYAMKGGIGTCSEKIGDVTVGALAVVNAFGNIVDPKTGETLAGAKDPDSGQLLDFEKNVRNLPSEPNSATGQTGANTTLALVATDAGLNKEEAIKVAEMAQDGLCRAIRPAHTFFDGDAVICISTGNKPANHVTLGTVAADLVAGAIVRAVTIANV
ncbi:MAG: P1 family peptidase [bacterium]